MALKSVENEVFHSPPPRGAGGGRVPPPGPPVGAAFVYPCNSRNFTGDCAYVRKQAQTGARTA